MNKIEKIAETALTDIITDITDHVFEVIQHDRDLMQAYLKVVSEKGRDTTNKTIGKYVKNRLKLTNLDRSDDPESTLILSYQRHGLPE